MYDLDQLRRDPASRRQFLAVMGAAGLGLAATGLLSGTFAKAADPAPAADPALTGGPSDGAAQFSGIPGPSIDIKILNFALTLEILEADLYRQALNLATRKPLSTPLSGNPGDYSLKVPTGGLNKAAAADGFEFLVEFTYVEAAHRDFLRAAILAASATPVNPNPGGYRFPKSVSAELKDILLAILPLEETGVRAYLGALPYFTDLSLAQTAGGIYSTEARHSAVISEQLGMDPGPRKMPGDLTVVPHPPASNTFEYYLKPQTVLDRASVYFG